MKDIAAGFAYSDLLTAAGLTFLQDAEYRIQVRSAPGAASTLFATLRSVENTITWADANSLRIFMSAEITAPMTGKAVYVDVVREDTNPDEYLGGQQSIKIITPVTIAAAETQSPTAPLITSTNPSGSYPEGQAVSGTLTADRAVTWTKGGVDAWAVTLDPSTGEWSLEETDFSVKSSYAFSFKAIGSGNLTAQQAVAIAITDVVVTPAPSWSVQPSISGTPTVGQTLTGNTGTIANGTLSARQWLRNGSAISGATSATFQLASADDGAQITFRVTATGSGGSATATSAAVSIAAAPIPAPAFTTQPSISPTSGTAGTTTYTATPGTVSNGSITSRAWMLGSTTLSTGLTAAPTSQQVGALTYRETATGAGGTVQSNVVSVAVNAQTATPTLTLTGPLTYSADATSGTTVANIGNVPAGITPAITPNDGRLAVAGNATDGWRVVKGLTASTAGSFTLTVSAAGANPASVTVTVTAASALPPYATINTFGDSITLGLDATNQNAGGTSWAARIATSTGATLSNRGISGTVLQNSPDAGGSPRTDNGRDRFAAALLSGNKRAAVFIAYGYNDARYVGAPATMNVANYTNDYREILNGLIIGGYAPADIYVGTPYYATDTGLNTGSTGFTGQTRSGFAAYAQAARDVAAEFGVKLCDLYAATNNATYIADVDAGDKIHPRDVGHGIIADAWRTQTVVANTLGKPASVNASASGSIVTVTAAAVTGAASYEYVLIQNPATYASNTSGTFNNVAEGAYFAKARAVFSNGTKGPWSFTTASVAVAAAGDTTAPTITSSSSPSIVEGSPFSLSLTANETVTWTKTGGADATLFTLSGNTLTMPAKDWEAPVDADANNTYIVQVTATDAAGNATTQTITVTVTNAAEGLFLQDSFTAPTNTNITSLTPEIGGTWITHPTNSAATPMRVDDGGRLYSPAAGIWYNSVAPPSADYFVEASFFRRSVLSGDRMGFAGRCSPTDATMYLVRWDEATGQITLNLLVANALTQLGVYATSIAVSTSKTVRLTMQGDQISVQVDGTTVIGPVTNSALTTAGFAAARGGNVQGATTGIHLGEISAGQMSQVAGDTPGAGVARASYEPAPVSQPSTLSALVAQLGVTSADVIDYATGNAGGPFASVSAWLDACYGDGNNLKIGALPSGTYSHASAMQKAPRAIYGYGATVPEIVESLTHSTTSSINWGASDNRVVLTTDVEDFVCRHVKWTGFHTVVGAGRFSQPLIDPVDGVTLKTYPHYPSSTYKHHRLVNPRLHGAAMQTRRVGRIRIGGGTGTISALTARRLKPGGTAHNKDSADQNYYNDAAWAANTETVPVISSATASGDPAAVAASLIAGINAGSATTNTRAVAGRAIGEVYLIRDLLAVTTSSGPEDYLRLACTVTGSLTVETDVNAPGIRFVDCSFVNCDTVVLSAMDVTAPGFTEGYRCELVGTWSFLENQNTHWDGSGAAFANNIWRDCTGTRTQPSSGVQGTGVLLYLCSENAAYNRLQLDKPTTLLVERNTADNIRSVATDSTANAGSVCFVDARYPSPIGEGKIRYNRVTGLINERGATDANWLYGKFLAGGVEIAYNYVVNCGAPWTSTHGSGNEAHTLIKEGSHPANLASELDIHHNYFGDMPHGIPIVKVDQQKGRVRIRNNHFKNWRNFKNGVVQTDATHAGVCRFTEKHLSLQVEANFLENIDMGGSFLLLNYHNMKTTAASGSSALIPFPDADFSTWSIANNRRQNDGSADYPALTGDQAEFRFNGTLPSDWGTAIRTGFNDRLNPAGVRVGASQIMRDSETGTTYAGTGAEAKQAFVPLS